MVKKLLRKSLLMGVALLAGASSAWGTTETYSFYTWAVAGYTNGVSLGTTAYTDGEAQPYALSISNSSSESISLNSRFAFKSSTNYWYIRNNNGQEKTTGLFCNKNADRLLAITHLNPGDEFTITFGSGSAVLKSKSVNFYLKSDGTKTKIAAGTDITSGATYVVSDDAGDDCYVNFGTNSGAVAIKTVVIETSAAETMGAPSIAITGANGNERTVTITPGAGSAGSDATATYYTTDGTEPTSSNGTLYSVPFTINSNTTVKAVSYLGSTIGEVRTQALEAGTTIKLATPRITLTGMVLENGLYYPQYTIASDAAGTYGSPEITLTSTFGGAPISSPYTVKTAGTISVVASATGYGDSDAAEVAASGKAYKITDSYDFTDKTLRGAYPPSGSTSKINGATVYVYGSIATDAISGITLTSDKWGFLASTNGADDPSRSLCARWGAGNLVYDAFSTGQILAGTLYGGTTYAMSTTNTLSFSQYGELIALNVYSEYDMPTLADGNAIRLTFDNAGVSGDNNNNWNLDIYNNSSVKISNVRADWWDGPNAGGNNTGFTYPYTFSTDDGATAATTDVWSNFQSDMTNAAVDLTLSYTGGTVYVIGTMTNGSNVYYVNYRKEGQTGDLTYNLYGNGGATLSNITTASASVTTTPAHPTNVAVTLGTNGYATYANNVYPLDLTSAAAYKAAVSGDKVNFTLFEQAVPAGTGMLVEGTPSTTVNLPIADASTSVAGNEFLVNASDAEFDAESGYTYYAMIKKSDPLTFGTFAPGTLAFPANKAYLKVADAGAGARLTAVFGDNEATGISSVKSLKENGEVYNLNGQRVNQAAKGLYIVNGKKVVVK